MTRGKPAKPGPKPRAGETADQRIELRVTADEVAAIDKAAARHGVTRSEWIREACEVCLGPDGLGDRGEVSRACDEIEQLIEAIRDAI